MAAIKISVQIVTNVSHLFQSSRIAEAAQFAGQRNPARVFSMAQLRSVRGNDQEPDQHSEENQRSHE